MRLILILLLFLGFLIQVRAQHQITGTITDEQGAPLVYSNILLLNAEGAFLIGELSDESGHFTIGELPAARYILQITAIGYTDWRQSIDLTSDLELGTLLLTTSSLELEEVTVTAQKAAFERKADRTVVNVSSLPTAAGGNALDLLEKSPTVQVDRVSSNVSLLGQNGVLVFINEKRIRLDGADLLQYLESIPSSNIVSVELINHPPASYDADGTGGVINIILKEYEADGFNGSANVFSGYGIGLKYGGGFVFNVKTGKVNVYGDASVFQNATQQNSTIASNIQFDQGQLIAEQFSNRPATIGNYSGKLGLSYAIHPKTSVDVYGSYARRHWALNAETRTSYLGDISPIQYDLLLGNESNTTDQYNASLRVQQQLADGHHLSGDYDYLAFRMDNPTDYQLQNFADNSQLISQSVFATRKETPLDFHVGRIDYRGRLTSRVELEAGIKATFSQVQNNTALLNAQGEASTDPVFTDQMKLQEGIYAAYLSINGTLGEQYTYTAGLRYEYSDLDLQAAQGDVNRQISRLFPSVSVTKSFSATSRLSLAYRERIARPGFQNLAPAFFFFNPYTVQWDDHPWRNSRKR
ncbi:MAG: outer membrane beta-barrel protein, partial [Bacteroidota bacterium]